jgi:hypothetical protein
MALQPLPGPGLPQSVLPPVPVFRSILSFPTAAMHLSGPHPPIWFLAFPLVLCCGRLHLNLFWDPLLLHSLYMACPPQSSNFYIFHDVRSLYRVYSSWFHLGRQRPPSCIGPYILLNIFLSNVFSISSVVCVKVHVTLP